MNWLQNDAGFREELQRGWYYESVVADQVRTAGLHVWEPPRVCRDHVKDRHRFADEVDLVVEDRRVSVKSRRIAFTCPDDIPRNRDPLIVSTLRQWHLKSKPPMVVINISQETEKWIFLPVLETAPKWETVGGFDHIRGFDERWYAADKSLWRPGEEFPSWLGALTTGDYTVTLPYRRPFAVRAVSNRIQKEGTAICYAHRLRGRRFTLLVDEVRRRGGKVERRPADTTEETASA